MEALALLNLGEKVRADCEPQLDAFKRNLVGDKMKHYTLVFRRGRKEQV